MECGCSDTSDEANPAKKSNCNLDEKKDEFDCLTHIVTEMINERGIDPIPEENTPGTPQAQTKPILVRKNSVHCKLSTPIVSTHFHGTLTSTPAPVCFTDVLTPSPFCGSNDDMSPITMSAQKMPKSMQVRACKVTFNFWLRFALFSSFRVLSFCMWSGWFWEW